VRPANNDQTCYGAWTAGFYSLEHHQLPSTTMPGDLEQLAPVARAPRSAPRKALLSLPSPCCNALRGCTGSHSRPQIGRRTFTKQMAQEQALLQVRVTQELYSTSTARLLLAPHMSGRPPAVHAVVFLWVCTHLGVLKVNRPPCACLCGTNGCYCKCWMCCTKCPRCGRFTAKARPSLFSRCLPLS
jgi:hypothetical protein